MKNPVAFISLIIVTLGIAGCSTDTLFGRWITYRGEFNDAQWLPSVAVVNNVSNIEYLQAGNDPVFTRALDSFFINGSTFEDYFFQRNTNALLILHRGNIVFERYSRDFSRDSIHPTYSVTKAIVSLLVGIAHADRAITSLDDSLSDYVDNLPEKLSALTIRHCLNMVSGMAVNHRKIAGVPVPWSDEVREYYHPNARSLVNKMTIATPPDQAFSYQNYNQLLLALVLERATGKPLSSYASEKLWQPLGMEYPARWSIDSDRYKFAKAGSGFNATAIDLARIGYGVLHKPHIIPKTVLERVTHPCCAQPDWFDPVEADSAATRFNQHLRSIRYSDGWWGIESQDRYDFFANGHFGQFVYVSPDADLIIVRLGAGHGGSDDSEFSYHFFRLATQIKKELHCDHNCRAS